MAQRGPKIWLLKIGMNIPQFRFLGETLINERACESLSISKSADRYQSHSPVTDQYSDKEGLNV